MNSIICRTLATLGVALTLLISSSVSAFLFTEDADINDPGQVESESWLELIDGDRIVPVYNQEFNMGVTDRLQVGTFGGVGWDVDDELTVANPGLQTKIMVRESDEGQIGPSLGIMAGAIGPWATGSAQLPAPGGFALIPMSFDFDVAVVHAQLGWGVADEEGLEHRPLVGLATEVGIGDTPLDLLAEVVNADPVDPTGPPVAFQGGLVVDVADRFETEVLGMVASDTVDDQSLFEETELGLQAGVRIDLQLFGTPEAGSED